MDSSSIGSILSKSQRLILGSFVLLVVDVIWVSSSELTKFIYHNETFEKPFFCTYMKTSMFTLYLLGFCFWPPWRDYCNRPHNYFLIDPEHEDDNFYSEENTGLSKPTFVPVKTPDREIIDRSSGTESDDSSIRSVRFNKLAEVRHMSEAEATEALLARLSYQASLRAGEYAKRAAIKLPVAKVAKLALVFCVLWFLANYTFQLALAYAEAGTVTVLSSTSSLFTLFLAAMFPSNHGDKCTISKFVAVVLGLCGVILVCMSKSSIESHASQGIALSLASSLFYSIYIVFLKQRVDHEDKMDIPLFFGFVGFFNLILLWPLFFLLHYNSWEVFEWPSKQQMAFLLLNGLLGTVVSEALWLWGCFLTSSVIGTVALSLTLPMTTIADVFLKKVSYPSLFYLGTVPMVACFIALSMLSHYDNWDPVYEAIRGVFFSICRKSKFRIKFPDIQSEQTEALIGINSNEHEA